MHAGGQEGHTVRGERVSISNAVAATAGHHVTDTLNQSGGYQQELPGAVSHALDVSREQ